MAPSIKLCGSKRKFIWTDIHENAFNLAKSLISKDVLLRFPNHELPFEIFADASTFQDGATIKQRNLPIVYFSKKLTPTKRRYSTIEQKTIRYIKGQDIIETDAPAACPLIYIYIYIYETMLNHLPIDPHNPSLNKNPLDLKYIQSYQEKDIELTKALKEDDSFIQLIIQNVTLIHHKNNELDKPKIIIPHTIQYSAKRSMHNLLGHAGISRLSATLRKHFWFPRTTKVITQFVQKYEFCQRHDKQTIKYGHVPPKQIKHLHPWGEVSVDMISPWKVTINNFEYQFRAITCIDTIIGLPEVIPVDDVIPVSVISAFEHN